MILTHEFIETVECPTLEFPVQLKYLNAKYGRMVDKFVILHTSIRGHGYTVETLKIYQVFD